MPRLIRIVFATFYVSLMAGISFTAYQICTQYTLMLIMNEESASNNPEDAMTDTSFLQSNTIAKEGHSARWLQHMDVIQRERQETLQLACRKYVNQTFMTLEEFASDPNNMVSLIYNDEHRIIYNFIHKVASQHIVKIFNKNAQGPAKYLYNKNRLSSVRYKGALMRLRNYKKFIFVRDPFARFVSVYRNKFIEHPDEEFFVNLAPRIIKQYREDMKSNQKKEPEFAEFIDYITGYDKSRRANTHWSSYVGRNRACLLRHDFIGKLETMEEDSDYLFHHVLQTNITVIGPRSNTTTGHTDFIRNMYSNVSKKSMGKLVNFYQNDFRVFGYNMSIPN